jgi:hypothetical protein
MANKFSRGHNFTDGPPNEDVIAAYLHALIEEAAPTTAFVDDQVEKSLVTGDYAFIKDTPGNRLAKVKTDALLGQVSSGITVGDVQVPDNAIQNAEMWYWQRGLNVDRVINGTDLNIVGPDRWRLATAGTWNLKIRNLDNQDLTFSGYPRQNRIARITAIGGHPSLATTDTVYLQYVMEGLDFARIDGLPWAFTIWLRTNRTGTMYASARIYVLKYDDGSALEGFTQDFLINPNAATALQLFYPARTSNLARKNNEAALVLNITLAAGTGLQGSASSAWAPGGGFLATTRQTNFFDAANNYVDIWGPCLRTGSIAVPQRISAAGADELRRLQRYYAKSYGIDVNPGTAVQDGEQIMRLAAGAAFGKVMFPVTMRAVPTIALYNSSTGAVGSVRNVWTSADLSANTPHRTTRNGFSAMLITGGVVKDDVNFHYTAEADF